MAITGTCSRLIGDVLHAFGSSRPPSAAAAHHDHDRQSGRKVDDSMVRALITVFGMENDGRIKKEKVRGVAEKLGFEVDDEGDGDGDEVAVEEVLGGMEEVGKRKELLHEAFKIFDEDGDGYIEAVELKRVLDCLGLDGGWEMGEIEKMVRVVDLNFDGKVDFGEFQLMMMN
ncbi:probable calcium-binding protein CML43 [Corylus avellana]|uniref:probable calcium-binding protein CML43 n=1 Tax=Corylus avellana TaxID=13451 RepID=UPI00286B17DB|nr:probable calcium-binding protein CML43 [Corylus avellana]